MDTIKQEEMARDIVGVESDAKHFVIDNEDADNFIKQEAISDFNSTVDEYVDKMNERNARLSAYAQSVVDNANDLEIMPIGINIIVRPFSENPFQRITTSESGIFLDTGGKAVDYKSHEDGQMHEEQSFIEVATVMCVGPECKYIQEGDTVMYTIPSAVPVPFFKQGLKCLPESRITAVINAGLQERFNNIK